MCRHLGVLQLAAGLAGSRDAGARLVLAVASFGVDRTRDEPETQNLGPCRGDAVGRLHGCDDQLLFDLLFLFCRGTVGALFFGAFCFPNIVIMTSEC